METIRRRRLGGAPDRERRVERFSTVREQKPRLDARSSTWILGAQRNHQSILRIGATPEKPDAQPEAFTELRFTHLFLQPLDNGEKEKNTLAAIEYCLANPAWKLSLQTHKLIGIP